MSTYLAAIKLLWESIRANDFYILVVAMMAMVFLLLTKVYAWVIKGKIKE